MLAAARPHVAGCGTRALSLVEVRTGERVREVGVGDLHKRSHAPSWASTRTSRGPGRPASKCRRQQVDQLVRDSEARRRQAQTVRLSVEGLKLMDERLSAARRHGERVTLRSEPTTASPPSSGIRLLGPPPGEGARSVTSPSAEAGDGDAAQVRSRPCRKPSRPRTGHRPTRPGPRAW
jgi:hypothetical protein